MSIVKNLLRNKKALSHHLEQAVEGWLAELKSLNDIQVGQPSLLNDVARLNTELEEFSTSNCRAEEMISGAGFKCFLEMRDGSVKMDCAGISNWGVFGAGDENLLRKQMESGFGLMSASSEQVGEESMVDLIRTLILSAGGRLGKGRVFSGVNIAGEAILDLIAYHQFPADGLILFEDSWLGNTGFLGAYSDRGRKENLRSASNVLRLKRYPGNSVDELERLKKYLAGYAGQTAALMIDPLSMYGGLRPIDKDYLFSVIRLCREAGILIWMNETESFSSSSRLFMTAELGLWGEIDILSLSGGLPVSVVLWSEELSLQENQHQLVDSLHVSDLKGTIAVIDAFQRMQDGVGVQGYTELESYLSKKASQLKKKLNATSIELGVYNRYCSLKWNQENEAELFRQRCFEKGVLVSKGMSKNEVFMKFPLAVMEKEQLDVAFEVFESCLNADI